MQKALKILDSVFSLCLFPCPIEKVNETSQGKIIHVLSVDSCEKLHFPEVSTLNDTITKKAPL
jgi:hypothetical protein